jgi:hypothetical protein
MRYTFLTGTLAVVLAAGQAAIKAGDASGQTPRIDYVPNQYHVRVPVVVGQQVEAADAEGDEMSRLNALGDQLGQQAESLVKQLADATDANDRAKLKQTLEETLTQQFDTQQKVRELEVASIEARVKKLRDTISKRNEARRTIIERRLDQLVRESEGLGWNSPAVGTVGYSMQVPASFPGNKYGLSAGGKPSGLQPSPAPSTLRGR